MKRRAIITQIFLSFYIFITTSQIYANPDYYFKQISFQEGLTQSSVRCILNDNKGFIWIGTNSGLNRYDRHELKVYTNNEEDENSIPDNLINFIAEDSLNNIWISTERGLVLYNWDKDNFTHITYQNKRLNVRSY